MLRKTFNWVMVFYLLIAVTPAFAQHSEAAETGSIDYFIAVVVSAAFAMSIAASCAAIGMSRAIFKSVEGIARQPSASGKITTTMVIGLALTESLVIYVLVICLILFFANPFIDYVK